MGLKVAPAEIKSLVPIARKKAVAIVVNQVITNFGCTRIDRDIIVIAINCAAVTAFCGEAVTVIVGALCSRTEISRIVSRINKSITIRIQRPATARIDMTEIAIIAGATGAVDAVQI